MKHILYLLFLNMFVYADDYGHHIESWPDERKAHDGTLEYTSRDAHTGAHSRYFLMRSDPMKTFILSSVADPGCLSRIPDPDFYPSRISDPGSRIQKQQQKRGVKKN